MHKTSVYLTEEEVARLAGLAEREGRAQSEIIRRAIRQYEPERRGDRSFAVAGVADGPRDSIAGIPESQLLEGFGS